MAGVRTCEAYLRVPFTRTQVERARPLLWVLVPLADLTLGWDFLACVLDVQFSRYNLSKCLKLVNLGHKWQAYTADGMHM